MTGRLLIARRRTSPNWSGTAEPTCLPPAPAASYDFTPLHVDGKGVIQCGKGILTMHGVSTSEIGTAASFEVSKACRFDGLKRAAVHLGIGRELNSLPEVWVTSDSQDKIPPAMLQKLAACLRMSRRNCLRAVARADPEGRQRCMMIDHCLPNCG